MQCDDLKEFEAWLVTRKAAGEAIDIATCKLCVSTVQVLDPYGYRGAAGTFPEEGDCIGRDYFVCSENSDGWIWYGDLPKEKKHALDERIKREASDEHWIFDEAD